MNIQWSKISLLFFLMVAVIGTWLRGSFFLPLPLEYGNLVHTHSHVAFQGWVYSALFLLITNLYLTDAQIQRGRYRLQFLFTIFIIIGVLLSFSLQGYGLYSIICSTLFQFLVYWFTFRFLKDIKQTSAKPKKAISLYFVKAGLWLGILSSFVPFAIGTLSAKGMGGTEAYYSMVYTFLHLQYNGWFLFLTVGLLFRCLELDQVNYNQKWALRFFWLFLIAVIPAVSLSLLGMGYKELIIIPAIISALLQLFGLVYFFLLLKENIAPWASTKNVWLQLTIGVFFVSFTLKIILQFLCVFPQLEALTFGNKPIILAYLHLSLIGMLSFLLLGVLIHLKWLRTTKISKIGVLMLLLGFMTTELMLIFQGLGYFYGQVLLFTGSGFTALGIFCLILVPKKKKRLNGKN